MEELLTYASRLNKRGFKAQCFETGDLAKQYALDLIGAQSVGIGASVTIEQLGLYDALIENGNTVFWHWKSDVQEWNDIFYKANRADVYVSSINAILESGAMVNIDGNGNRAASLFFGPKMAIIIAGRNKLCTNYEDGISRIKCEACPGATKHLGLSTPCAITGTCTDCYSPGRACNVTVIHERPSRAVKTVHVLLVDELLGY